MRIEYDPNKSARNEELRGLSFESAMDFEWATALIVRDERRDYGEDRYLALAACRRTPFSGCRVQLYHIWE